MTDVVPAESVLLPLVELTEVRRRIELPRHGSFRPIETWRRWWDEAATTNPAAAVAASRGFVLSVRDLPALGMTRGRARWYVERRDWVRPAHGVLAPIDVRRDLPEIGADHVLRRRHHALRGAAAALLRPDDKVTGRTAAVMHGLPTLDVPTLPELASSQPGSLGRRPTAHLMAATLDEWQLPRWFGVRVSDVARTLVDLARRDRHDAIMAVDAALREDVVAVDDLEWALAMGYRWPGIRQAREVLSLADPRAESPLESIVRLAIHDLGLPEPELQVCFGSDRVDFYWRERGLVLEADGRLKYTADERWSEKRREQRLRRHVDRVERITWWEATSGWAGYSPMLVAALG